MKVSFVQKFLLFIVFAVIRLLWLIDNIGFYTRKVVTSTFRLGLYAVIVVSITQAFSLEQSNSGFYNIPTLLNPETPSVLGAIQTSPIKITEREFPPISALSVYGVDLDTGTVLVNINENRQLAPASTTKLMTALVAIDVYELNDLVVVPQFCTEVDAQKAGFVADEVYSVENLLTSLLISSSADSACALSIGKIPYSKFVEKMNSKAKDLGLINSVFTNPVGLDDEQGLHYSTAKDLYEIALEAKSSELIREKVKIKETEIYSASGIPTHIANTNILLWEKSGTVGIKTGKTSDAGEVLIYEYDDGEKNVLIIVMRSNDRFGDTLRILDWIFESYTW